MIAHEHHEQNLEWITVIQDDNDNPYCVTALIDDEIIEPETAYSRFWVRAAKFCALLPILYVPVELIGGIVGIRGWFPEQYYIFFVGTWLYALISIPAVIGINFKHSLVGLFYGIVINLIFVMFALFWLLLLWTVELPKPAQHPFPPLFGLPVVVMRIFYVVMYVGTICVFLIARKPLKQR
ncbi:MAG: hypothetical protein FWD31_01770, partial [Planctomycetaceae bacterium]|nr:hypothetical protein [Planctomycetaceae bacterium]